MNFESRKDPIASFPKFFRRQFLFFVYSAILIGLSLLIGTAGYCYFGDLAFIDGFYNASMILTGMGPVNTMMTENAKLFSSFYALFSGIAFLSTVAIFFAPIVHRFLHYLHLENIEKTED